MTVTRASLRAHRRIRISIPYGGCTLLAVAIAFATPDAAGQIFRCTVDGKTVYSDRPCGGTVKRVEIEDPSGPAAGADLDLRREVSMGRLAVGMTTAQVQQAWGKPAEIATERDGAGVQERWTYRKSGETTTVHFKAGQVSKLDKVRSLTPPADSVTTPPRVATQSELEEDERAEKANERRFLREGMTQEEVRGRLGPPLDRRVRTAWFGMADCWSYPPTPKDPQTRTDLCFSVTDTRLVLIERNIQR